MSKENIVLFYAHLERDPELRRKAMSFQEIYENQEDVIDAFINFAEKLGYEKIGESAFPLLKFCHSQSILPS